MSVAANNPLDPSDPFEQSEQLERAERVAYLYLSPVIVALGMAGCVANLVVLGGGGKRFEGRFFVYLRALAVAEFAFLSFAVSSIAHVMDHRWDEETDGGSESYAEVYYEAHIENGVTSGFLAAAVFIIVCVTCDRYLAICHPTFYLHHRARGRGSHSPHADVVLAFLCGMMLQAPRFFYSEVVPSGCSAEGRGGDDVTEGPRCDCVGERGRSNGDDDDDHTTCYYESSVSGNVGESPMWLAYVVLCELAMRVLPCLLLIVLNFLMVRDFNVSMRRRKKLKAAVFTVSRSSIFERVDPAVRGMTVTHEEEEEEETKVPKRKTKKLRFMESIKRSVSGRFGGGGKENAAKDEPSVDLVDLVLQHQEQKKQQQQQLPPTEIRVQLAGQDEDDDDEEDLGVDSIRRVRSVRHPSERTMNTMLEEEEEEGTNTGGGSSSAATTAVAAEVFGGGAATGNVVLVEGSGEAEVAPPAAVLAAHRPSAFLPDGASAAVRRLRRDRDARRKSLTIMARERNVIGTLGLVTALFALCNLPQAVCNILQVFGGYDDSFAFQIFRIVANLLELVDASVNFYIYFFCNREIRARAAELYEGVKRQFCANHAGNDSLDDGELDVDPDLEDSGAAQLREMFPAVFEQRGAK